SFSRKEGTALASTMQIWCCRAAAATITPGSPSELVDGTMEQKVVLALRKRQAELKAKGEASMNFTRIILKFGTIRSVLREIRAVFEQFDQDKSGAIDHTELGTMMRQLNVQMGEEDIGNLFRLADFNGANQLTLKQLLVCICIGYVLGVIPDLTTATDPKAEATAAGAAAAGAKAGGGSSATAVAAAAGVNVAGAGASSTASVVGSTGETAAATAGAAGSSEAEALAAAAGRGRRGTFQGRESNIRLAMDLIVCAYLMFDPGCRGHIRKEDVLNIISETGGGEKAVSGGGGGGGSGAVQPRCSAGGGNGGTHHLRGSANGGGASGG
ncbi:unnamed protein product, partial [Phaeothamnion confervicola]